MALLSHYFMVVLLCELQKVSNSRVYEDRSVVFTTDGAKNVGNKLKIDTQVCGMNIKFDGEDFLYVKPDNGTYITAGGKCSSIEIG